MTGTFDKYNERTVIKHEIASQYFKVHINLKTSVNGRNKSQDSSKLYTGIKG